MIFAASIPRSVKGLFLKHCLSALELQLQYPFSSNVKYQDLPEQNERRKGSHKFNLKR